jgi:hypothetical protein
MNNPDDKEIKEQFKTFDKDKYSLIISTVSVDNEPLTSYSPFVKIDNDYFICISSNMPHFTNMMETKKAHVMIIEDEEKASNIYARKRLYFGVTCKLGDDSEKIFKLFDERYGDALSFFRDMKDFKVVQLIPHEKSLVLGFGAAYKMDLDGELGQKNIGHK